MRELEGTVVRGWPDVLIAPDKARLLKLVAAAQRRGELAAVGPLITAPHGAWYVRVIRLRAAPPARARWPWVAGGVVLTLAAAAAAGWWLISAVPVALAGGGAVLLAAARYAPRAGRGCTTTITVRHRH